MPAAQTRTRTGHRSERDAWVGCAAPDVTDRKSPIPAAGHPTKGGGVGSLSLTAASINSGRAATVTVAISHTRYPTAALAVRLNLDATHAAPRTRNACQLQVNSHEITSNDQLVIGDRL